MEILNCVQGTDEWYAARLGMITASCFSDVLAKGQGKTRDKYMKQLLAERIFNEREESYTNACMERGKELEAEARCEYEKELGVKVQQIGFARMIDWVGASPDGLIEDDGLLELKCPKGITQLEVEKNGCVPSMYIPQVQGQMWVLNRKWCDFVSYHPKRDLFVRRVYADKDYIANLQKEVEIFISELQDLIKEYDKTIF